MAKYSGFYVTFIFSCRNGFLAKVQLNIFEMFLQFFRGFEQQGFKSICPTILSNVTDNYSFHLGQPFAIFDHQLLFSQISLHPISAHVWLAGFIKVENVAQA